MAASEPSHVELYTDGSCRPNPGPGGWAYILRHPASGKTQERSGAEPVATNQRMELRAVIEGLAALRRPSVVELTSDSQYVLRGLREWMRGWKARGWRKADGKPVENLDLWQRLDELTAPHDVRYHWIKGHSGHPENERCDALANAARESLVGVPGSGAGGSGQA